MSDLVAPDHVLHPTTGQVLNLLELTPVELADLLERELPAIRGRLADFADLVRLETVRRVDATGDRKADLGGVAFEVNRAVEETYAYADLVAELEPLIQAGKIDRAILATLTRHPPRPPQPRQPPPAVDKVKLNSLIKSTDNRELLAALAKARRRHYPARTVKIVGRAVESTAVDVGDAPELEAPAS